MSGGPVATSTELEPAEAVDAFTASQRARRQDAAGVRWFQN